MALGLEISSLIGTIITVVDNTIEVYDAIKDLHGLPQAFQQVNDRLPLVNETLGDAKGQTKNANSSGEAAARPAAAAAAKRSRRERSLLFGMSKPFLESLFPSWDFLRRSFRGNFVRYWGFSTWARPAGGW